MRSIEVMGEAAKRIPRALRTKWGWDSLEADGWDEGQVDS